MCKLCINKADNQKVSVFRYDPTRTTVLRNTMVSEGNRRFTSFARTLYDAIVKKDILGINNPVTYAEPKYKYKIDIKKIEEFNIWLQKQIDKGLFTVTDNPYFQDANPTLHNSWMNKYLTDTYKRAMLRAQYEAKKAGYDVPDLSGMLMGTSIHVQTLGLLYLRAFNELKGVTDQMAQQISRVLVDGLANGENSRVIGRKLVSTITGTGNTLAIKDKLGRFIPAKRRAEIIARTEITRAYHLSTIQSYRNWGIQGVTILAEFRSAHDNRVCPECLSLDGKRFTLDEVEGLIPVHPQCRCYTLPIVVKKDSK